MFHARLILAAYLALSVAGCILVDSRISEHQVAADALSAIEGRFDNKASYFTQQMGVEYHNTLTALLDESIGSVDGVTFRVEDDQLLVVFDRMGVDVSERRYKIGADIEIDANGVINLAADKDCTWGGDSPGAACGSGKVTMFVDGSGSLVVIQEFAFVGLVTIIPAAAYTKFLAVFPRNGRDAP